MHTLNNPRFLAKQLKDLRRGSISRRQFMNRLVAAGLAVPTALGMADEVLASTPKSGGRFKIGFGSGSTTDSLDPATYEGTINTSIAFLYGNHLVEIDANSQLQPELATSYTSDDAKTWIFEIREGVEFHNGQSMTPADVIATINHHRGEGSKSAVSGQMAQIENMRADGNNVIFELEAANADFPYYLADYHLGILPSTDGKVTDPQSGIGTGGYIIDSFEPGVRVKAHRNPNYFKTDRAFFDEVEFLAIIDPNARQTALLNGSVHAIDRVDPKTVAFLARAPNINIVEKTSGLHCTIPMRVDVAPFDNYDLRMALKLAVNRQELVDKILLGHGSIGNDHPISSTYSFFNSDLPQREFDAEKAAFHYKKSGHIGRLQLSSSDAAFPGAVDAAQLVAASAASAGIEIEVVREPSDGYWSNVWNKKPWSFSYWSSRPTEDLMFSAAYTRDQEWNETAWRTGEAADRFNAILVEARAQVDSLKRRTLYADAQALLNDDGGVIIPMFLNHIAGVAKSVAHGEIAANWEMDGAKAHERWWFA